MRGWRFFVKCWRLLLDTAEKTFCFYEEITEKKVFLKKKYFRRPACGFLDCFSLQMLDLFASRLLFTALCIYKNSMLRKSLAWKRFKKLLELLQLSHCRRSLGEFRYTFFFNQNEGAHKGIQVCVSKLSANFSHFFQLSWKLTFSSDGCSQTLPWFSSFPRCQKKIIIIDKCRHNNEFAKSK